MADRTVTVWDSLREYHDAVEPRRDLTVGQSSADGPWHGTDSWAEASEMATDGWAATVDMIDAGVTQWLRDSARNGIDTLMDVAGDEVNIGLYLEGEPENMITVIPTKQAAPSVALVVNACVHGGTPHEKLTQMATAVISALESARAQGVLCEVWTVMRVQKAGIDHSAAIKVASSGEPYVTGQAAFACGHPSMLRRLFFAEMEGWSEAKRKKIGAYKGGGYGMPAKPDASCLPDYVTDNGRVVFLPDANAIDWTAEAVVGLINKGE